MDKLDWRIIMPSNMIITIFTEQQKRGRFRTFTHVSHPLYTQYKSNDIYIRT